MCRYQYSSHIFNFIINEAFPTWRQTVKCVALHFIFLGFKFNSRLCNYSEKKVKTFISLGGTRYAMLLFIHYNQLRKKATCTNTTCVYNLYMYYNVQKFLFCFSILVIIILLKNIHAWSLRTSDDETMYLCCYCCGVIIS